MYQVCCLQAAELKRSYYPQRISLLGLLSKDLLITSDGGWNCRTLLGIQRVVNDSPENKEIELWLQIGTSLV